MAQTLFPLLLNSSGKRYLMLAEGTHTIIMEKNRLPPVRGCSSLPGRGKSVLDFVRRVAEKLYVAA